jgi:UDP-N-acetylmuramate--alanine ligase
MRDEGVLSNALDEGVVPSGMASIEVKSLLGTARGRTVEAFVGKSVFLVGIGGAGMSGLARLLQACGAVVSGVDREPSELTRGLRASGIEVGVDDESADLPGACDVVVVSAAVPAHHGVVRGAVRRGIPVMLYAEALGACMAERTGVAVAGTHGKSTTSAMLGCALTDAGLDPTVIVGATSRQLTRGCLADPGEPTGFRLGAAVVGRGALKGCAGLLVAEACEYRGSFLNYRPRVACITSVEADHLDYYRTFDDVIGAFHRFAGLVPPAVEGGKLIIGHENAQRVRVCAGVVCAVETIGFSPEADWVVGYEPGTRAVEVRRGREVVGAWRNHLAGAHNAVNAATAFAMALSLGAERERVEASLANFRGVDRRMQFLGERRVRSGVVRVYDDYGHHPTEVDTTLRALRETERPEERSGRLICVFQPHQHSRTRHLMDEFARSFGQADLVLVPPIYFVRDSEAERTLVSSEDLVRRMCEGGGKAEFCDNFGVIVRRLGEICRGGDVVVSMGAGPIWQVARAFLAEESP